MEKEDYGGERSGGGEEGSVRIFSDVCNGHPHSQYLVPICGLLSRCRCKWKFNVLNAALYRPLI